MYSCESRFLVSWISRPLFRYCYTKVGKHMWRLNALKHYGICSFKSNLDIMTDNVLSAPLLPSFPSFFFFCVCVFYGLLWLSHSSSDPSVGPVSNTVTQSRGLVSQQIWVTGSIAARLVSGWETFADHLVIKLPFVAFFESDAGNLARDKGHRRSSLLWCGRGRNLFLLGLVSWGQGQGQGDRSELGWCQVQTYFHFIWVSNQQHTYSLIIELKTFPICVDYWHLHVSYTMS